MPQDCAALLREAALVLVAALHDNAFQQQADAATAAVVESLKRGHKILTCGNGGSAADALHLSEELIGRFDRDRRAWPAICLNSDAGAMTCIANDYGYERIFSRQIEALGQMGDVLVVFSTSGKSANVLRAIEAANAKKMATIALLGKGGGPAGKIATHPVVVPGDVTARIQEVHGLLLHLFCQAVEDL